MDEFTSTTHRASEVGLVLGLADVALLELRAFAVNVFSRAATDGFPVSGDHLARAHEFHLDLLGYSTIWSLVRA